MDAGIGDVVKASGLTCIPYGGGMTDPTLPTGPDPEAIISFLTTTYPATDLVTIPGAWFFSLDRREALAELRDDRHDRRA